MTAKILVFIFSTFLIITSNAIFQQEEDSKRPDTENVIQIAILIDTSNSMDGLIEQTKSQLWTIVNELALARYEQEQPTLEIALYEFGNDGIPAEEGHIRKVCDLTTDLDKISEELFALKTYGGYEYCGQVIDQAVTELQWSKSNDDLKMIFIAGNEEFTQGSIAYDKACKNAISKGIIVNTIFCGALQEGINTKWKDGADLADGEYMNIDQNQQTVYIESPYDDEIVVLNTKLNSTYIAYGMEGEEMQERQKKQDDNAQGYGQVNTVNRAVSKSSKNYNNSHWDLVDASDEEDFDMEKIEEEQLPEEMKEMNSEERTEYIAIKSEQRQQIQDSIQIFNDKRKTFVAEKRKEMAAENNLDDVMIKAIRQQAEDRNYIFEE